MLNIFYGFHLLQGFNRSGLKSNKLFEKFKIDVSGGNQELTMSI